MKTTHCKRGHEFTEENTYIKPSTGGRACIICIRAYANSHNAVYYKANRDRILIQKVEWNAANKEKRKAYREANKGNIKIKRVERYKANREKHLTERAARYAEDPNKYRAISTAWRERNPERVKEINARWSKSNPEKTRLKNNNRRAKRRGNGGKLSTTIQKKLLIIQRGKCAICKKRIKKCGFHIDHIIPISRGGKNIDGNVQLTCPKCNHKKGGKDPILFMQEMGYLL